MPGPDADRNLLLGIIALQMDFVTREGLISALNAWILEKHRPLGEILVERNDLDTLAREALDRMVDLHVARHGGDPRASLAALSSTDGMTASLQRSIADADIRRSIAAIGPASTEPSQALRAIDTTIFRQDSARFRKIRDHAQGGLGIVFVARDEELHREVALKEIQDRHADDPASRARFLMEAEITGGLEHPGIVPVYGLGHYDDGRPFYAMRFIKGDSLKEAIVRFHANPSIKNDPGQRLLALQKLLRRFLDVCNAVAYAHSRGVLHRDLKPDNVMVGKYGETLVVDWGLAKAVGRSDWDEPTGSPDTTMPINPSSGSAETLPGSVVGTPTYMSPEQAAGRLDLLGPRSDVYSLGATLYALLTGRVPFAGDDHREVLRKVEHGEFSRPRESAPWLDPAVEAICLKAMALRPADRYASPQSLAEDLERGLADEPVTAYPEPWTRRSRRWARRHRTALATAASAATVAALLLGTVASMRIAQRQRTDASALASLRQAESLAIEARNSGDLARWEKAIAEALRARERLESGGGSPGLLADAGARLAALRAEQNQRQEFLETEARDRRLVANLDEARLLEANAKNDRLDTEAKNEAYQAAFRAYGIDVVALPALEAAKRIRASKVADEITSTLMDWIMNLPQAEFPSEKLRAIDRELGPDPVRDAIFRAIAGRDASSLRLLCEHPEDRRKLGPRLRLVSNALLRLDPVESVPLLERIRRENPADFWLNNNLGVAYKNRKPAQVLDAWRCLSVAVALRPRSAAVHNNLANALLARGDLDPALDEYRTALRINPQLSWPHIHIGHILTEKGDLDGAIKEYKLSIELNSRYWDVHNSLGIALASKGDLDGAIAAFQAGLRLYPQVADLHYNLGKTLADRRKIDQAIFEYGEAIRIKPDYLQAHTNLGGLLQDKGDLDGAIARFRQAIQIDPQFIQAHLGLGFALRAKKDLDGAIAEYRAVVKLDPGSFLALDNLGYLLGQTGRLDEAVAFYNQALKVNPDDAGAQARLARIHEMRGDFDGAIRGYSNAVRIRPKNAGFHASLANNLRRRDRFDEAANEAREAVQLDPKLGWAYQNLGWALLGKEDWRGAAAAYREAIGLLPEVADLHFELGEALEHLGQVGASNAAYRAAIRLQPASSDRLARVNPSRAACLSALASSGRDQDKPPLDEAIRFELRTKAIGYLNVDLSAEAKRLDGDNDPVYRQALITKLDHWRDDPDLAGIRDDASLAKLPEAERVSVRTFWAKVEALRLKAGAGK